MTFPQRVKCFYFDLNDLSTDKVEYYNYETIKIHSNWIYYYDDENEVGFVQIHILNETGTQLWASQEYYNNSIYMDIDLNVSISEFYQSRSKSQESFDVKFYTFLDDGEHVISAYRENIRILIKNSGVYNFSMCLDKDSYNYNETCYINSTWNLIFNPIHEIANISFQILDVNQDVKWTSDYFDMLGAESHITNVNFSLLDINFEESSQNFSIIAKFKNFNYLLDQNYSTILKESLIQIFGPSISNQTKEFSLEIYELTTNKIQYYDYESIEIFANWTYYYNENAIGFVQICILQENNSLIWQSLQYHNRSIYMEADISIPIRNFTQNLKKPSSLVNIEFYIFNNGSGEVFSGYNDSMTVTIEINSSDIYNFSLWLNKKIFQYNDLFSFNSSWYSQYNPTYEIANVSFELKDENQKSKWHSNDYFLFGVNSISISINLSLFDLGLNRVKNNFTLIANYSHSNHYLQENDSRILFSIEIQIIGEMLKGASINVLRTEYYFTSILEISAYWEIQYLPEYEEAFTQLIIKDESRQVIWSSQEYNDTGLQIKSWEITINELPLNYTKDFQRLEIYFYLYWRDFQTLEIVSENIINKTVRLVKSNLQWDLKFELKEEKIIESQVQISEKETNYTINSLNVSLQILYNSSEVFENDYLTNSYGIIIVYFQIQKELFYGDNLFILEIESELYNNTTLLYNYYISKDASLSPLSVPNLSPILYTGIVTGIISGSTLIILFKIKAKKKKLSSLTITVD